MPHHSHLPKITLGFIEYRIFFLRYLISRTVLKWLFDVTIFDLLPAESLRDIKMYQSISAMKPILYRVETYIVPETENLSMINKLDDLTLANQFTSESIFENNNNEKDASFTSDNKYEELARFSTENSKLIGVKIVKDITNENDILLDECLDDDIVKYYNDMNFCCSKERVQKPEFQASVGPQEALYPARQFSRVNSLISIDERSENSINTKLNDFCYHGYKNGCTASIQSPEEVSEEIFRENWLQKIEILRHRETILRERETNLQKRERELFRKEKELRITERMLNDKMKQVEILNEQLKYQKDTLVVGKRLEEVARILSDDVEKSTTFTEEKIPSKKDVLKKMEISKKEEIPRRVEIQRKEEISRKAEMPRKEEIPRRAEIQKKEEIPKKVEMPRKEEISKKVEIPRQEEIARKAEILKKAEIPKNPIINSSSIVNPPIIIPPIVNPPIVNPSVIKPSIVNPSIINSCQRKESTNKKLIRSTRSSFSSRKSFSKTHLYGTVRSRERPKKIYDDLNSTLSAASIDSPNKQTSVLFNPTQYQKPSVFTRSASERWSRHRVDTVGMLQRVTEEKSEYIIEEEKIFQKVSDNICALQEKEARFQDYGLVDCIPSAISGTITQRNSDNEERLSSYLNLETGERYNHRNSVNISKDRPISWTSETQQNKHQEGKILLEKVE
ncbi:uncharacterized protein LOC105833528 isoform X2 [Monomorium pharaonis]|uniref:uncharacterized protein LOC105833528 isoform X2 n=1 Tax=Monomorium pharaonis TaxID=307658 RepID=UPI0017474938|nr:uncharacterized protein LOC105833528 isoform X2 [Monomorium pharaonis]